MKEPGSKLPWRIEDVTTRPHYYESDGTYEIIPSNDGFAIVADSWYYNQAPDKQDAEYIVMSANLFPEAVELLKKINTKGYCDTWLHEDIEEFLKKLEDDNTGE